MSPNLAVVCGHVRPEEIVLVRLHHECLAGDVFVSTLCECRANMQRALTWIARAGTGVLLYLRGTGVCPLHGEQPPDCPAVATAMLDWLGIRRVRLLLDVDERPPAWLDPVGIVQLREVAPHGLTARELQVLKLLAAGLVTKQIAERLAISRRTAAHHIEHIYAKIGASTRAAAATFAVENGISAYWRGRRDASDPSAGAALEDCDDLSTHREERIEVWLLADGNVVQEGQEIAVIPTDKVDNTLEAQAGGTIELAAAAAAGEEGLLARIIA